MLIPGLFAFLYALIFCYLIILVLALPTYLMIRDERNVSFIQCVLFGVVFSWVIPLGISLFAGKLQSWFITALPPHIFYDLFFGTLFGGSIGALFHVISSPQSKQSKKVVLLWMAAALSFGPFLVPVVLGVIWSIFLKPSPPATLASPEDFSSYNYGADAPYEQVHADSEQAKILKNTLLQILPIGTSKEQVESILWDKRRGGLIIGDAKPPQVSYLQRPAALLPLKDGCAYFNWWVTVEYDAQDKLKKLELSTKDSCGKKIEF